MSWLAAVVAGAVAAYASVVVAFALLETRLLFPAPRIDREVLRQKASRWNATEVELETADGTRLYGWRLGAGGALVLHFSGNGTSVAEDEARYAGWLDAGLSVLHVNYRGYPGSDGTPSEAGLRLDALAAWQEALRTHAPEDVIVHGKSMGGGVAVGLAATLCARGERPRALVVESTYASVALLAKERHPWLPVDALLRSRLESHLVAHLVDIPTLVVHGTADTVIPAHHGRLLASKVDGAQVVIVEGAAHNDVLLFRPEPWRVFRHVTNTPRGAPTP